MLRLRAASVAAEFAGEGGGLDVLGTHSLLHCTPRSTLTHGDVGRRVAHRLQIARIGADPARNLDSFMHKRILLRMRSSPHSIEHLRKMVAQAGITQMQIAKATRASQSQVSRVLSGRTSMTSKLAKSISAYALACSSPIPRERIASSNILMDALADTWDGTPHHAQALAAVIRSLSLLSDVSGMSRGAHP
ncbi:MAG: helix-turn-helix transcriptional regulator [Ideonella sp.]